MMIDFRKRSVLIRKPRKKMLSFTVKQSVISKTNPYWQPMIMKLSKIIIIKKTGRKTKRGHNTQTRTEPTYAC